MNPMPGGFLAGYHADTGLDIAGLHQSVYALAAGTLDYAEGGHTLWNGKNDDPFAIRLELDEPILVGTHRVTHVWYAHLSKMDFDLREGTRPRIHVEAGQRLGISGIARGSPHLHLGMLLDGKVEQEWGTFLDEADVREVLGGFRNKTRLPGR
jgi:murein DD-endopeptidase MepM/ murein hydrolase activator NlpD